MLLGTVESVVATAPLGTISVTVRVVTNDVMAVYGLPAPVAYTPSQAVVWVVCSTPGVAALFLHVPAVVAVSYEWRRMHYAVRGACYGHHILRVLVHEAARGR